MIATLSPGWIFRVGVADEAGTVDIRRIAFRGAGSSRAHDRATEPGHSRRERLVQMPQGGARRQFERDLPPAGDEPRRAEQLYGAMNRRDGAALQRATASA